MNAIPDLETRLARMEEILADAATGRVRSIEVSGDDPLSSIETGLNIVLEDLRHELEVSIEAARNLEVEVAERTADLEDRLRTISEQKDLIVRQRETIVSLSTPVLSLREGVLALPVIGEVDAQRGTQITAQVLKAIIEREADVVILDITGVPLMDTRTIQHLMQTMEAAALLGAQSILSGVRPEVAKSMVSIGADVSSVKACATLATALEHATRLITRAGGANSASSVDSTDVQAPGEREARMRGVKR